MSALEEPVEMPESDPEIESALKMVPQPSARPEFKADLHRRFLAAAAASAQFSSSTQGSFPLPAAAAGRRRVLLRLGGLLAAALILAVGFLFLQSPAPRWRVLDLGPGIVVKADGSPVQLDDTDALARTLQHAQEIEVENASLVLQVGDLSLFDLGPGTRANFFGFDRNSPDTPYEVRALSGRLRVRTGPAFRGKAMTVRGDVIAATLTGTALAIDFEEYGTCVCCLHGEVQVTSEALGHVPRVVPPDNMCLVHRDAREPRWGGLSVNHAGPLKALEQRASEIWPPR